MRNICFLNRWWQKMLICLSLFSVFVSTISEAAGPPPVITFQPLDQTVPKGGTAIFTVVAVSGTTLSYTWFKGNQKMAGKTARILTINNVGLTDATGYYVAVKNAGGTVTSRKATLIIGIPDTISPTNGITSPTANQGWSNAVFTVTGAARDNVGVANVFLSLNGGGWTTATTANGWTNWSVQVSLTTGTNTVQACAVDAAGNVSTTNSVKFVYVTVDWAPGSLNGLVAAITPDDQSTLYVGFWTNTFSQSSTDTNNNNGVGTYSYTKLSANTARLVIAYTSPPTITNDNASVFLTFTSNNT